MNRAYGTATHVVNKHGVVDMIVCESSACSDLSVLMSDSVTFPKAVVWCAVSAQWIIHFRASYCFEKYVYVLQGIPAGRWRGIYPSSSYKA
jgi:hypothetical protein